MPWGCSEGCNPRKMGAWYSKNSPIFLQELRSIDSDLELPIPLHQSGYPKQPTWENAAESLARISKWLHLKYNVFFRKLEELYVDIGLLGTRFAHVDGGTSVEPL